MIAAIRSCLTSLRRGDQKIWWRIKSKVNQHWDLIIAAVKSWDAKAMVFRFGKHEMCPTLEEVHRIFEISLNILFYLEKDDLERADDQWSRCSISFLCVGIR